jgi:NRPS condensation-like uncharacterized protein
MVAELGFEPRQSDSESLVLPLHHSAIKNNGRKKYLKRQPIVKVYYSRSALP